MNKKLFALILIGFVNTSHALECKFQRFGEKKSEVKKSSDSVLLKYKKDKILKVNFIDEKYQIEYSSYQNRKIMNMFPLFSSVIIT